MPARRVLMIAPIGFRANPETAADNVFQRPAAPAGEPAAERRAGREHGRLRALLEERGIEVVAFRFQGPAAPPDQVFPNNWFSTHPGGRMVLYPMRAVSRRRERRAEILAYLAERYPEVIDLSPAEEQNRFLEGTGSLVIDERSHTVYASLSPRTDAGLVAEWAAQLGYRPLVFGSLDGRARPVYHTNVMMSVGSGYAIVCGAAIDGRRDRSAVLDSLIASGHEVVDISLEQMHAFCANVLELSDQDGGLHMVLSQAAWSAFSAAQQAVLAGHVRVIRCDLGTIELHGGGSARCMLAELW